jgi:hypothetical protein
LVAAIGAEVILEIRRPMQRLMQGLPKVARIVPEGDVLPTFDFHCPLMSLPLAFNTGIENIPGTVPYLSAEPDLVAAWEKRLPNACFRVGIVWQGSPTYKDDRNRSVPLACFAPLSQIPGVRLISLQKIHGLEQLDGLPAGMEVMTLGAEFDAGSDAFIDTAAVMMSLDLIVAIDTAVVHLAGALNRPVWLPVAANPHWVWMLDRDNTPWYPKTRLFRQNSPGDWQDVFRRMAVELDAKRAAGELAL